MKLVYTNKAKNDLVRLRQFIASENPKAAKKASQRIIASANSILNNPLIGRPLRGRKDIREIIISFGSSNYLLRYDIKPDEIRILRVWHGKENWNNQAQ